VSHVSSIKKSQKESLLRKELSSLFQQISLDEPSLHALSVSRVSLSDDKSVCSVFFYSPEGQTYFEKKLDTLKLFKSSLRKAIAQRVIARYVPEFIFKYDTQLEKQLAIENLLDQVKKADQTS
jgi:ribosome-binding factor A